MTDEFPVPAEATVSDAAALEIHRLLAAASAARRISPSPAIIVRYLAGILPQFESTLLEAEALSNVDLRRSLVAIRRQLDVLESLAWEGTEQAVSDGAVQAEVARAWQELRAEQLAGAGQQGGWTGDFERLWSRARAGYRDAQASVARLFAFAAQWRSALLQPDLALARGAPAPATGEGTPVMILEAEIDALGTLRVVGSTPMGAAHAGQALYLALSVGDAAAPVAEAVPVAGVVRWEAHGIGQILGIRSARIPPDALEVRAEPPPWPPPESAPLVAQISDAHGAPIGRFAALEIRGGAAVRGEALALTVALPPATRSGFAGYALELELAVTSRAWQRLGEWPIGSWPPAGELASERRIEMSCPGCPDVALEVPMAFRARLRPM